MKKINKEGEPNRLGVFRAAHPNALWERDKDSIGETFRCCRARYQETLQQLRTDQGNICAYCEQDLMSGTNGALDDCRIEHFHPKSKQAQGEPNWSLEWSNLLAVCCGGNQSNVVNSEQRFDSNPKNYSCDVPKGNKILDTIILNPLKLPNLNIWKFHRSTGELSVNEDLCLSLGLDVDMAHQTIKELNLNSPRLIRLRKTVLNNLNYLITERLKHGQTIEQAISFITISVFRKNRAGDWPSFFSAARFYLGQQAELVLAHPI
ncbi:TPA: retron system putative HNH endonuclease [Yersinia enterocolitica]|uniref:retron system putative HNH endonuclease n=1 Tax=Yersinia enterocolitica TaxID=630 RepID=UPI0028751CFD|nr:TIGR02646 family protein [Yersinia enterocolitica]HDL6525292.1 TIGR02646 family protein [Yersinia enterocolitica]HDL6912865.1 TIGR02646 family protein [Yersinia enterocolitica]HDL6932567.1 TIGR02646 family protein [Yersinia enterocolitica]HDW8044934.1 TIGR02646 family protein [Yersinia enterocolitica]